jgi:hypothetical protein
LPPSFVAPAKGGEIAHVPTVRCAFSPPRASLAAKTWDFQAGFNYLFFGSNLLGLKIIYRWFEGVQEKSECYYYLLSFRT